MPALNFLPLPRVSHPKPPGQTDGLPTLPGPWVQRSFQPSMKFSMAVMRSLTLVKVPRRMAPLARCGVIVGMAALLATTTITTATEMSTLSTSNCD